MIFGSGVYKKLKQAEKSSKEFYQDYSGPGFLNRLKRLLKYKGKYIKTALAKKGVLNRMKWSKTFWGDKMLVDIADSTTLPVYYFGILRNSEFSLIRYVISNLKSDGIFYDVGANYGFYSLLALNLISDGEVHAFEPSPTIFPFLKKQFKNKNSKNIFLNQVAFSNEKGTAALLDMSGVNHSGASTLTSQNFEEDTNNLSDLKQFTVQTTTLDKYVQNNAIPTIIKIDVEGSELEVVEGGRDLFKNHDVVIAMELKAKNKYKKTVEKLFKMNYSLFGLDQKGNLTLLETKDLNQIVQGNYENFIFKK